MSRSSQSQVALAQQHQYGLAGILTPIVMHGRESLEIASVDPTDLDDAVAVEHGDSNFAAGLDY